MYSVPLVLTDDSINVYSSPLACYLHLLLTAVKRARAFSSQICEVSSLGLREIVPRLGIEHKVINGIYHSIGWKWPCVVQSGLSGGGFSMCWINFSFNQREWPGGWSSMRLIRS